MDFPTPNNVIDVRYFMALVGYYRRFIEGFSKISHQVTSKQKKDVNFGWFEKCKEIFQQLKKLLTSVSILKIAYPKIDFVVCMNAHIEGLGGVLMQ